MNRFFLEASRHREARGFKEKLKKALTTAFLGGVVLVACFVLLRGGGDHETFREVESVRHSAMPGLPGDMDGGEAGRTMVATYYGYELEGSPTASGRPFDPEGYTAAHRMLPLGTRLRVSYGGESVRLPSTTGVLMWLATTWISRWRRPGSWD